MELPYATAAEIPDSCQLNQLAPDGSGTTLFGDIREAVAVLGSYTDRRLTWLG